MKLRKRPYGTFVGCRLPTDLTATLPRTSGPLEVCLEGITRDYPFRDLFDVRRLPFNRILSLSIPKAFSPSVQDELIKCISESKILVELKIRKLPISPFKLLISSKVSRCLKRLGFDYIDHVLGRHIRNNKLWRRSFVWSLATALQFNETLEQLSIRLRELPVNWQTIV